MRNQQCSFVYTNLRPTDYKSRREGGNNNRGDCTTRAMAYCLKGEISYNEIEAEQYRIAKLRGTVRNQTGTWDKILTSRGYKWVQMNNLKSRANVANWLSSVKSPMITLSRTHVCAIENGNIYDNWDSRGGRVFGILVKEEEIDKVMSILRNHNIDCEYTTLPKHNINRHTKYYYI